MTGWKYACARGASSRSAPRGAQAAEEEGAIGDVGDVGDGRGYLAERRRTLLDEMAEGFATLDWEYRVTYGNGAGLELFGLRLEEVLGRTFWEIFPAARTLPVAGALRRAMELGVSSIEEFLSPTAGRWVETRIYPTSSGVSLYVRDIEQRKRKELQRDELLREIEETRFQLEEAQRIAHVGSFEYLADDGTTVWSDEELRIYGLEPGMQSPTYEVLLERFIHPEDAPVLDETFRRALESGSVFELEHRIVHPDGEVRWVYDRARPYVDDQGRLVRYVGATLDVTDRKLAEAAVQQELARTRLLQDVAIAASTKLDLDAVARHVLDALRAHLQLKGGDVRRYEDGCLRLLAAFDYPEETLDLLREVEVETSDLLGSKAVRERRVLTHEDEAPSARRLLLDPQHLQEDRYVYVPVPHRGRTMGLISLTFAGRRPFREDELSLFAAVAQVLGQAMENARLLATQRQAQEAARTELEHSDILVRGAAALASSIDPQAVLETLGDLMLQALGVTRLIVLGLDAPSGQLQTLLTMGDLPFSPDTVLRTGLLSEALQGVLRERRTARVDYDESEFPESVDDVGGEPQVRRALLVPVVWQDELLGLVGVDAPGERHDFTDREVELVEAICDQAAAAIANARAYEAQRTIATTLQASFRHRLPPLHGLDVGLIEVPASAPALVGGDFWDAFELPDGRVLFVIGDVAGKGVTAAGMTETVRSFIRAFSSIHQSPAFILRKTSELLLAEQTRQDHYVTALLAIVDQRSGRVVLGSAGHPAPVHLSGEEGWVDEPRYGPPLGTFPGRYGATEVQLEPGDYLILYTDGVTEARRGGDIFGESRLVEVARGLSGTGPQTLAEALRAVATSFASTLMDDLEVLVIRRTRGGE